MAPQQVDITFDSLGEPWQNFGALALTHLLSRLLNFCQGWPRALQWNLIAK